MAGLRFAGVGMRYGEDVIALEDITFNVPSGEFVFLTGRSGAGKSTVLKLAAGILMPTEGEIYLDGVCLGTLPKARIPEYRRRYGIMDTEVGLLPDRTVLQNVLFPLHATGQFWGRAKRAAKAACEAAEISHRMDHLPHQLSGGEKARALLARAIVGNPEVLLLDEPTANLDHEHSWDFMCLVETLSRRGITVLAASHDHQMVSVMKKRVITLAAGRIVADERKAIYNMWAADAVEERRVLNERAGKSIR